MSYITGDDVGSFFTATVIRWMFQMMPGWLQINGGVELWMRSLAIKLANNLRSHRSAVSNCLVPAKSICSNCPSSNVSVLQSNILSLKMKNNHND